MTAKILEFKRKPEPKKAKLKSVKPGIPAKSDMEIFFDVLEDVMGDWQFAAAKNALNQYFVTMLGLPPGVDYINDLNELSEIEKNLRIKVGMFYPGCTINNPHGWLASFHYEDAIFTTPPHMATEANARAMNIMLFIHFTKTMKTLKR